MSGKRSRSFKCAVHHRDREVCSENDFHLVDPDPPLRRMVRIIADEFLSEERDRKLYADQYTCCPPPLFILCITLIELGFFTYYWVAMGEVSPSGPVPIDSVFIYRPDRRQEVWRFIFYMVLHAGMPPAALAALLALSAVLLGADRADACSSRSTPKPRPPAPTPRPNVTFHTYACPPAYAAWYCLNGATCFTVKIAESLMYSCECSDGYMGNRCEFKDLDGSYLPVRQRVVLERASIASGASIAVILVVVVCMAAYVHCQRRRGVKPPPSPLPPLPATVHCRPPLSRPPPPPPGPGRPPTGVAHLGHLGHLGRPCMPPMHTSMLAVDRTGVTLTPGEWPWRAPIVVPVVLRPVDALHRPSGQCPHRPPPHRPCPPPRPPPPTSQQC